MQNAIQNSQIKEAAANNGAAADEPFASLFGAASSSGHVANSDAPLPNPWAAPNAGTAGASTSQAQQQNPFAGLGGSGGFGGLNIGGGMPDGLNYATPDGSDSEQLQRSGANVQSNDVTNRIGS